LLLPLVLAHDHDLLGSDATTVERALPWLPPIFRRAAPTSPQSRTY